MELLSATQDIESQLEKVSFCSWSLSAIAMCFLCMVSLVISTENIHFSREWFQVSAPLLILHGAADKVTDPLVSQFLYEKASSKDKTLKIYEEGYHGILEGEPDDRISDVHKDIISWLDFRCSVKWGSCYESISIIENSGLAKCVVE